MIVFRFFIDFLELYPSYTNFKLWSPTIRGCLIKNHGDVTVHHKSIHDDRRRWLSPALITLLRLVFSIKEDKLFASSRWLFRSNFAWRRPSEKSNRLPIDQSYRYSDRFSNVTRLIGITLIHCYLALIRSINQIWLLI